MAANDNMGGPTASATVLAAQADIQADALINIEKDAAARAGRPLRDLATRLVAELTRDATKLTTRNVQKLDRPEFHRFDGGKRPGKAGQEGVLMR